MATPADILTILEKCRISPPPNTLRERTLSLTFLDLSWLFFSPIHQLFLYYFSYSGARFIQTVIPNMKHSLSITLQHFFPFCSNLIVFPALNRSTPARKPEIRYTKGDSVALTFAECTVDFNDLVGNHPRDSSKFYPLVPLLEHAAKGSEFISVPLFFVQVTVFPNYGISVGLTNHHTLGDASSVFDFLKAWTSIARYGSDDSFLNSGPFPFYERVITYPKSLDEIFLKQEGFLTIDPEYLPPQPINTIKNNRITLVLTRAHINKLKKWLLIEQPNLEHVSSFSVACAYVWSCMAKSRDNLGLQDKDELERFIIAVDWRSRLDPPIPTTYFGNCVWPCFATIKSTLLLQTNGFLNAAESLGKAISETIKNRDGMMKDAENVMEKGFGKIRTIAVSGTPKINFYDVDFGWENPIKSETISIDYTGSISIIRCKDSSEDLEIGLSLPSKQMDDFIAISRVNLEGTFSEQKQVVC